MILLMAETPSQFGSFSCPICGNTIFAPPQENGPPSICLRCNTFIVASIKDPVKANWKDRAFNIVGVAFLIACLYLFLSMLIPPFKRASVALEIDESQRVSASTPFDIVSDVRKKLRWARIGVVPAGSPEASGTLHIVYEESRGGDYIGQTGSNVGTGLKFVAELRDRNSELLLRDEVEVSTSYSVSFVQGASDPLYTSAVVNLQSHTFFENLGHLVAGSLGIDTALAHVLTGVAPNREFRPLALGILQKNGFLPSSSRDRAYLAAVNGDFDTCVRMGSPAVEPLLHLSELSGKFPSGSKESAMKIGIVRALGVIGNARAIDKLISAYISESFSSPFGDGDVRLSVAAAKSLQTIGTSLLAKRQILEGLRIELGKAYDPEVLQSIQLLSDTLKGLREEESLVSALEQSAAAAPPHYDKEAAELIKGNLSASPAMAEQEAAGRRAADVAASAVVDAIAQAVKPAVPIPQVSTAPAAVAPSPPPVSATNVEPVTSPQPLIANRIWTDQVGRTLEAELISVDFDVETKRYLGHFRRPDGTTFDLLVGKLSLKDVELVRESMGMDVTK